MSKILLFLFLLVCTGFDLCYGQKLLLPTEQGFIKVPGELLYFQRFGVPHTKTPPIIVLHGGPGMDQSYLLPQMLELAKDHEVIFYDQRGSGKSSTHAVDTEGMNMKRFVQDLEAIRKYFSLKKMTLLGHSWGGLLAVEYTIVHPLHVDALILLDSVPMTLNGVKTFDQRCAYRLTKVQTSLDQLQNSVPFQRGDPETVEKFYYLIFQTYCAKKDDAAKITLHFSQATAHNAPKIEKIFGENFFNKPYDLRPQLHRFNIPVLIIQGDQDPIPVTTALETKDALPHSTLLILTNCGHFPYVEQPQKCFQAIKEFLK
ncbi:MAG: alpha/beta fold hydrolase [Chthoniobacterales bacterium]